MYFPRQKNACSLVIYKCHPLRSRFGIDRQIIADLEMDRVESTFGRSKIFIRSPVSLFALEAKRKAKTIWLATKIQVTCDLSVAAVAFLFLVLPFALPCVVGVSWLEAKKAVSKDEKGPDCHFCKRQGVRSVLLLRDT